MSQHDFDISNANGAAFRADVNAAIAAIVSQSSGATAPSTTYAYQWWADTTAGILKQRNAANSAWIDILNLATGQQKPSASQAEMEAGTEAALRFMSPLNVAQAIAALASGGKTVPARQSILAGAAAFIQIGTGLACNLLATATPVRFSFAAGMGANGAIDYVGSASADVSSFWSGLTASNTNYLFVDRNTGTGALTGVASLLPYIAQDSSASISVVNGQHTYVHDTGQMYVGNGSVATAVQRDAVGECVAGASTITSVISYAKLGRYDSGWTANLPAAGAYTSKNHNIGITPELGYLVLECTTADLNYAVGDRVLISFAGTGVTYPEPMTPSVSRLAIGIATGTSSSGIRLKNKSSAVNSDLTASSWKYKFIAQRGY